MVIAGADSEPPALPSLELKRNTALALREGTLITPRALRMPSRAQSLRNARTRCGGCGGGACTLRARRTRMAYRQKISAAAALLDQPVLTCRVRVAYRPRQGFSDAR